MAKEAAQRLADDGRIVSILTVVTVIGSANFSAYVGGKAAIEGFNICLNKELGERGITVNTVWPGVTETGMNLETLSAEARQTMIAQTPLGRLGKPEDIAEVVTFLVSDQCERLSQIQTIPKSRGKRNQH